ncbi:type IV toxin-antitoxin system AbiEi family antitoxin domain-containing protein [Sulfurovum sp.]|uniref:type IV toxin-antitoxin system AbiEi family antitoxin domain-containing protein n=1 Tax=Sulfurovum sp. TaxID=1969726 RepID=UPI0025FAA7A3|nr:type IV toxin-antitoxin system AbiEi family antitoxin domain-containing protein [Sulfurovum sp.]
MSLEKELKLKQLYQLLPEGVVAPSTWLTANGYSPQLLYMYVKHGWLTKIGRGAYLRPSSILEWQGAVLGLQKLAELPFHVGGLSALNILGYAHYLPIGGEKTISLYGAEKPPAWIKQIESLSFSFHKKPLFGDLGLKKENTSIRDWQITVSSPERAILELLYQIDEEGITFQFVAEIFEGLTTLSPRVLNKLLQNCNSRKVKRLFLFFANYYNFPWAKHISKELELGAGKLQIVKDGNYNKTYMITVPKGFNA